MVERSHTRMLFRVNHLSHGPILALEDVNISFFLLSHCAWFSAFVSLNGNQVNAYNGSDNVGQNERFGDKITQETIGNRRIQEETNGYYPNINECSNVTQTDDRMSY